MEISKGITVKLCFEITICLPVWLSYQENSYALFERWPYFYSLNNYYVLVNQRTFYRLKLWLASSMKLWLYSTDLKKIISDLKDVLVLLDIHNILHVPLPNLFSKFNVLEMMRTKSISMLSPSLSIIIFIFKGGKEFGASIGFLHITLIYFLETIVTRSKYVIKEKGEEN